MESIFFFFGTKIENIKLGIFIEVYPTVSELSYNFKALSTIYLGSNLILTNLDRAKKIWSQIIPIRTESKHRKFLLV